MLACPLGLLWLDTTCIHLLRRWEPDRWGCSGTHPPSEGSKALFLLPLTGLERGTRLTMTGWWFGTFVIFPYIGNVIIPIG